MTYDEITLWRHFMQGKGVLSNFEYLYKAHRFDKRDLDKYLEDTLAEDVILSAFDFTGAGNTIFGFKYWKDMDQKWQLKLREFRLSGNMIGEMKVVCPHCNRSLPKSNFAYNPKGQLHKHCRECESGEWDRKKKEAEKKVLEQERLAKEARQLEKEIAEKQAKLERMTATMSDTPAEPVLNGREETARQQIAESQANLGKTTKVCSHCGKRKLKSEFDKSDTTEDGLQSWCRKCQSAASNVSNETDCQYEREEKKKAIIAQAKPVSIEKLTAPRLGEYDATLHYKSNQKSITFNAVLSEQLQKGQFTKCYLNSDRSHRQFLIFNRVDGANVVGVSSRASMLLGINSADIVRSLGARFNLNIGENYYLHITRNLSRTSDIVTVEILAARTREEYVKIAQRREEKSGSEEPEVQEPEVMEEKPVVETPKEEESQASSQPLLDFDTEPSQDMSAEEILEKLTDRNLLSERDLARFLHKRGWKLQEPVTSYKKFTL